MEDELSKCSCNQDRCNLKHIESVAVPATYMYECTVNFNREIFQTRKFCDLQYYFPNKCNKELSIHFETRKCWYNKINTRTYFLSIQRILQPYVDAVFESIFTVPQGRPLPKAIKSLFDFLDLQASELGIQDPETLHTWKTNRYAINR